MDKKNKNPNVPNLRFLKFNQNYETLQLKNTLKIKSGKDQKQVEVENGIYNIYGTGGIIGHTNTFLYDKESVGIGRKGTIDKPVYFDQPFWTVDTLFYSEIYEGFIPKYIFYLFQTINWKKYNTSTGVPSLTSLSIENIEKSFPCYDEQLKVANFLTMIDMRIETQIKIIELKQSLIKDIEDRILWKTTNTQTKPIREFLTEINNKSIIQNQYPLLSSTKKGLFLQTDYFNKEAASSNNIGYKIVHKGDIIISPQNLWMGNITYNDKFDNGLVSPSYRIYKVKEEYNAFYISRILMSYRALSLYKNISEQGASIVRRNLNVDAFNELCFPIPNKKKQDEVGLFLSKLHQELKCETWILMQLKSQKNYLLNNMFI